MADEPQGKPNADDPSQADPPVEDANADTDAGTQPADATAPAASDSGPAENPSEPAVPSAESGGGVDESSFDQSDIDALLDAAGEGAAPDSAVAGGADPATQADTDEQERKTPAAQNDTVAKTPEDPTGIDQSDIDALLAAAGGDDPQVAEGSAAEAATSPPAADTRLDSAGRPFDEAAAAMAAAIAEEKAAAAAADAQNPPPADLPDVNAFSLPDFAASTSNGNGLGMDMLSDVQLHVKIELGRTRMLVEDVVKLGNGSVVELDRLAGDPVDVFANERLVARGEVLVLNDNFCVRICEIVSHEGSEDGDG